MSTLTSASVRIRRPVMNRLLDAPLPFAVPYIVVFLALVVYPVAYGFYLGRDPQNYISLFGNPTYRRSVLNTVLFVGLGVNIKMLIALLLSGFFTVSRWWIKVVLAIFLLPWAIPDVPGFLSFHFMLSSQWGMINLILNTIGIDHPPTWLVSPGWGFSASVAAYIWKWLPFWTLILLAARTSIPRDVYEASATDGATGVRQFLYVTFPMLRTVYLTSVLLSTIWTLGNYNTIFFVTGGGPIDSTQVFATLGIKYAFVVGDVGQGVAIALTALPVLIPLIIFLVRRLGREG